MTQPLKGTEEEVKSAAIKTAQYIGELEAHLRLLDGVKNELAVTVSTKATGTEIQNQLHAAHQEGAKLRQFLENIEKPLLKRAGKITEDDLRGKSQMAKSYIQDGQFMGHSQDNAGDAAQGALPAVNVNF